MHLAQLNIARMKGLITSPVMKEFYENIPAVNAVADAADGFIWRLQDESGDATSLSPFDDPYILVNMSVWKNLGLLKSYMLKTGHLDFLKRRYEWFEKMDTPSHVMWWVDAGHIPTLDEAKERLEHLAANGDTPFAFSMRHPYKAEETP